MWTLVNNISVIRKTKYSTIVLWMYKHRLILVFDPRSVLWIDREISIRPIHKIFSDTLMRELKKKMEPLRGMHEPWSEQTQDKQVEWEPDTDPKVAPIPTPLQK